MNKKKRKKKKTSERKLALARVQEIFALLQHIYLPH